MQDMGVDHRRPEAPVAQQFLHGADIVARLEEVGAMECRRATDGEQRLASGARSRHELIVSFPCPAQRVGRAQPRAEAEGRCPGKKRCPIVAA
jgi:hypothetical protein